MEINMNKSVISNSIDHQLSSLKRNNIKSKKEKDAIEIIDEEKLKKIEAYLEWEQEYYLINQSYLLVKT